jgi:phosphate transport system permease protein
VALRGSVAGEKPLFHRGFSWLRVREGAYSFASFLCAFVSILITFSIVFVLGKETVAFFQSPDVTVLEFFTGTDWRPTFEPPGFGMVPLMTGTLMITVGSALVAVPLGLASAIYLAEYARPGLRRILKPVLEVLAGVPTIVYGYFALFHLTPLLRSVFGRENVEVYNAASGAIVVGIMTLPLVTSLCDDALTAVPRSLREGGRALGSTNYETIRRIVLPGALSGIMASFILAVSRAIGETMAVTLAAGSSPKVTFDPGESIQTMTAYIVQISKGDTPAGSTAYLTLFAVGATLFAVTFGLNVLARKIVRKYGSRYS